MFSFVSFNRNKRFHRFASGSQLNIRNALIKLPCLRQTCNKILVVDFFEHVGFCIANWLVELNIAFIQLMWWITIFTWHKVTQSTYVLLLGTGLLSTVVLTQAGRLGTLQGSFVWLCTRVQISSRCFPFVHKFHKTQMCKSIFETTTLYLRGGR